MIFDGHRGVGVQYEKGSKGETVTARREVILCGGAVNTPQLLMLSGIGNRDHLAEHGIDVLHHSPEVGENMLDHLACPLGYDVRNDSLFDAEKPLELVNYLARHRACSRPTSPRHTGSCAAARGQEV